MTEFKELEEVAEQFLKAIDATGIEAWLSKDSKRVIVHTHGGDLRAYVMSRFEGAEISITRTSVTHPRSFLTKFSGAIELAAKTFKEIHGKLEILEASVDIGKRELADIKLPSGINADRKPDGTYVVTMKKTMSLFDLRQFSEKLK